MGDIIKLAAGTEHLGAASDNESFLNDFHEAMAAHLTESMGVPPWMLGTAATTASSAVLTTHSIMESINRSIAELDAMKPAMESLGDAFKNFGRASDAAFMGMRVHHLHENMLLSEPNRIHRRRRWDRSGSYHRRVQKKWTKRFGTHVNPNVIYMLGPNDIFMTPQMMARIERSLQP